MVIGYHLIWTAYGWWLPNDPRGSSSHEIRVEPIAELGPLHHGRKIIQPRPAALRHFYKHARDILKHELLTFEQEERASIGASIGAVICSSGYTCYACAVMPDHVHLLIRKHRDKAEEMIEKFQRISRADLIAAKMRGPTHPVWGGPGWKVFLNTRRDLERIADYIQKNPIKIGLPFQAWDFVRK